MDRAKKSNAPATDQRSTSRWLAVALAAQIGWGAYPVLLRYLQTVTGVPGLTLLGFGNLVALTVVVVLLRPKLDIGILRQPLIWVFASFVVLRGITNLLAVRFTLATNAQLIYLMTPFIVALLSRVVLKEQLPRHTFKALTMALLGALLILSDDLSGGVGVVDGRNDLVGISLALASSLFLALYMITTRRSAKYDLPGEGLLVVHLSVLSLFPLIVSLMVGEDWGRWQTLSLTDWAIFALLSLGVLLGANLGQIRSIQSLGASFVSSLMSIRLVSALLFASLLLGERLSSVPQLAGAVIVVVTITWYLRQQ